jgi:hypothetical protein
MCFIQKLKNTNMDARIKLTPNNVLIACHSMCFTKKLKNTNIDARTELTA